MTEAIAQLQSQVEEFQSQTETSFEELDNDISETHASQVETNFSNFSDRLTGEHTEQITSSFDDFEVNFSDSFTSFGSEVEGHGDDLKARVTEILQSTGEYAGETLTGELQDAYSNAIDNSVEALIAEVGENIALMSMGSGVTTSLSPVLPQLVAAQIAVEAINSVLDAIDIF